MRRSRWIGASLAALVGTAGLAQAQYNGTATPGAGSVPVIMQTPATPAPPMAAPGPSPIVGDQPDTRGAEFLFREIGIYAYRPLDPNCLSWGFNAIFLAGSDASFISPTAGGWRNTDPRFGTQFTDLNLTLHVPLGDTGGVDIKAGRQTT